jgi:hypothetical protein
MIALLLWGDNSPLDETISGDFCAVGASSICSETFGKVAHPLLKLKMHTNKKKRKEVLTIIIVLFSIQNKFFLTNIPSQSKK